LLGVAALIVGGLEYMDPDILLIALKRPDIVVGAGAALLWGRKGILSLLAKIYRILGKILEEK
jgi:hypothetical protein